MQLKSFFLTLLIPIFAGITCISQAQNKSTQNINNQKNTKTMKFELPKLPYALDALEPHISKQTMEFHYGKHHQAYVDNLNKLIVGTPFENASLEEIVKQSDGAIFNNAAQVWNHSFFWTCMSPKGGGEPKGALAEAIKKQYGSFDEFKQKYTAACGSLFGSGWVWLVKNPDGSLDILQTKNGDNPLTHNQKALLGCDVWEHAYYLDKQNRRLDYVASFFNIIDWSFVEKQY